ncbi:hypothetical protein AYI68_g2310 [Smittium mucronatum]|uniref:Uncharacterized protein n=1 Tax=Smittium mucronatum TaxID=133383 RepID=A0A1R0H351_9FUNG|nr:hypothetical protein AYI68_g2310 [Smittium mucronatum]
MGKRKPQIEEEYLFVTSIIPATELSIYAKLAKALSSINEDRKTAVYTYFKTGSIKFFPQSSKDLSLTAATSPIEYYVHKKIQNNLVIIVTEDPDITFANTKRVLLSDIATSANQNRLSNLPKAMELPGRVKQILETDKKLLMDQNVFDVLLAKNKIDTRKRRTQPFRKRQQVSVSYESTRSKVAMAKNTSADSTPAPNNLP